MILGIGEIVIVSLHLCEDYTLSLVSTEQCMNYNNGQRSLSDSGRKWQKMETEFLEVGLFHRLVLGLVEQGVHGSPQRFRG